MSQEEVESVQEIVQENKTPTPPRVLKYTEKGFEWHLDQYNSDFRSATTKWRRVANKIETLLSDSDDINVIRTERDHLEGNFNDVNRTYERLKSFLDQGRDSEDFSKYKKFEIDFYKKYDTIETDHFQLVRNVADQVRDIRSDKGSRHSSHRSEASRTSQKSNVSRSDVVMEAAALKAKLKFIDIEAKSKAELERIQTLKDIEIANAKVEALDSLDYVDNNFSLSEVEKSVPCDGMNEYVDSYVQGYEPANTRVIISSCVPTTTTTSGPTQSNLTLPRPLHGTEVVSSCVPIVTTCAPYINTQSKSVLNPVADVFKPIDARMPTHSTYVHSSVPNIDSGDSFYASSLRHPQGENNRSEKSDLESFARILAEQVSLSRLPPPEPSIFYGDPLQYPGWKITFETLIEQRKIPTKEKVHYLKKYIGGSVKEVVDNLFLLSTDSAYDEAKTLLDQRYGDPFVISNAFRNKLEKWPKVNARDGNALRKYGDFLKQCLTAMKAIGNLSVLNDDHENRKMLATLPDWIVTRWSRVVANYKEQNRLFPPFEAFVDFIVKEAKIACDPVTSLQALRDVNSSGSKPKVPSRTFLASSDEDKGSTKTYNKTPSYECCLCKTRFHLLNKCRQFLMKPIAERKKFVKDNKLCFGCLCPGHISRKCRKRLRCTICSKLHPSSLHGDIHIQSGESKTATKSDQKGISANTCAKEKALSESGGSTHDQQTENASSGATLLTNNCNSSKSTMIVPVYVSHESNPCCERLVYALLDTQSDTTFILEDTCKALKLEGTNVSLLLSTMHAENRVVGSQRIKGLMVRGFDIEQRFSLPDCFTRNIMPASRTHIPTPEMTEKWPHLKPVAEHLMPLSDCEIGLLIGYNCARALVPREVIPAPDSNGPYAQRTDLGWGIVGTINSQDCQHEDDLIGISHNILTREVPFVNDIDTSCSVLFSVSTHIKEIINPMEILKMMDLDFSEQNYGNKDVKGLSNDDKTFLKIVKEGIHLNEGHYEMPLPFRKGKPELPNNKPQALQRFKHLEKRMNKDKVYREKYIAFMKDTIENGFAEKIPEGEIKTSHTWYVPHHGVFHPQKPGKLRVVFDCSAKYMGESLNDHLLQGPDLTNSLVGVLCRFRKDNVAFMCDIEQMFYQFRVNPEYRDYFSFLWWDNNDCVGEPVEYRMTVHLFGASSSPGCANFGLKQLACDNELEFGSDVANFLKHEFYVDDGLKSVPSVEDALSMVHRSQSMCKKGGLRLHKFLSNSMKVLESISPEDRAKELKGIDLMHDELPVQRALGIQWCIESDCLQFRITLSDRPLTRRGILSTLSSVYDPLGLISPFILTGKQILQQMCKEQMDWDSPLPESLRVKWEQWRQDIHCLGALKIRRCFKPDGFGEVISVELHHFSDASTSGYGQCSYIRLVNSEQQVHCSLVMGKSRVTPLKSLTIPRLELTAAVVSVRVSSLLREELEYSNIVEWFWTDSNVVLGYIANDAKRFHVFVANRIQQIRDHSDPSQWNYVSSSDNPADIASRGTTAKELSNESIWFIGPKFLWGKDPVVNSVEKFVEISQEDPEVKRSTVFETSTKIVSMDVLDQLDRFSDWSRAKRVVARCLKFISLLRQKGNMSQKLDNVNSKGDSHSAITVKDIQAAELAIVKLVQEQSFGKEIEVLRSIDLNNSQARGRKKQLSRASPIYKLDPFLDSQGVLRVGGRIRRGEFSYEIKHPIIIPKKSHVTDLLTRYYHSRSQHQGRGITVNEIRANGYWIIGCRSLVGSLISKCVTCRKLRSSTQCQRMADLPKERLSPEPPFTYSGVDFFGPFYIKEGRKELKRYGVLFTCLSCRAVHVETANSLDTSSFINALRRFISIRGPLRQLRSDQGTNFVGAERELKDALKELDDDQLTHYLSNEGCDYITFKMNVPSASHMGGVWERQIRSVRNVLSSLLHQSGSQLDDESLRTFMSEATAIVNSRPLTVTNLDDPLSCEPLTPNHLLTMKSKIILPPPGKFNKPDLYSRRRWRRVQYLANEFWTRWKREFIQALQVRSKWITSKRNMCVGDIVIIKEDSTLRNQWRLGRVERVYEGQDGFVREVQLLVGDSGLDNKGRRSDRLQYLDRPVHKLVLLHETEEFPAEEPS